MDITKESLREMKHGWSVATTSPLQLSSLELNALKGVLLFCPGSTYPGEGNTAPVWVGGPKCTADDTNTGGLPIVPGSSMFIPIERLDLLYIVSSIEGQKIAWMLL